MNIKKIITAVASAVLLIPNMAVTAYAAEDVTPSGCKFSEIESRIKEKIADSKFASLETAVFTKDETLYTGCFGNADQEENIPADEDTVYDWGSITKTLTWVSVMQLNEQGKLDLDTDIRTYLPDGFLKKLKYDDTITMMNLMNHDAGWCETTYTIWAADTDDLTDLGTMLQDIEPPQIYHPGEVTTYSNFGAALAGYIVERVSGEDYVDYIRHHIYEPLGMEHTSIAPDFSDNEWVRERSMKLKGYAVNPMNGKIMPNGLPRAMVKPYPAGSACGTISDFVRYGQALLDENAPLFKDPETQKKMFSGSSFVGDTDIKVNSCGFWVMHRDAETLFHDGGTVQCNTEFEFDPKSGIGMISMSNGVGGTILYELPDVIFGETKTNDTAENGTADDTDISGTYVNSRTPAKGFASFQRYVMALAAPVRITKSGGGTYKMVSQGDSFDIQPVGNDLYRFDDGEDTDIMCIESLSDGTVVMHQMANDLVRDNSAPVKGLLFCYYLVSGIAALVLIIIKIVRKANNKLKMYKGCGIVFAAQTAKLTVFVSYIAFNGICRLGAEKLPSAVWCIINIICAVICGAAVISDITGLFSKSDNKGKAWKYILNIVFNVLTVAAVIVLELYRFWGI